MNRGGSSSFIPRKVWVLQKMLEYPSQENFHISLNNRKSRMIAIVVACTLKKSHGCDSVLKSANEMTGISPLFSFLTNSYDVYSLRVKYE